MRVATVLTIFAQLYVSKSCIDKRFAPEYDAVCVAGSLHFHENQSDKDLSSHLKGCEKDLPLIDKQVSFSKNAVEAPNDHQEQYAVPKKMYCFQSLHPVRD